MNQQLTRIFLALSLLGAWGVAPRLSAAESAGQQAAPAPKMEQAGEKQATESAAVTLGAEQNAGATEAAATDESAPGKKPEPITGAFGIRLGERFEPSMVAKVLDEQEQTYRGPDGVELKGTLLRVEPSQPDERFQRYSVKTTDKGIVYAIQGDYKYKVKQDEARPDPDKQDQAKPDDAKADEAKMDEAKADEAKADEAKADEPKPKGKGKGMGKPGNKKQAGVIQSACKAAVKTLAMELEARYGKPRGQGWNGLWFTFRQFSDTSNRGLKLYGHRCRTGMYSVIYTDEIAQRGTLPGKASTPPEASTPPTDSVPAKPEPGNKSGSQADPRSTANP